MLLKEVDTMHCPFCAHKDTKVLESRISENSFRRRRECLKCENRFTTYEKAVFHFSVIKKNGTEQPFNVEKIKNGVMRAYGKIEEDALQRLMGRIEQRILVKKVNPIKTTEIGKIVLAELKKENKIAYLRYATVYKSIEDTKVLEKELQLIA